MFIVVNKTEVKKRIRNNRLTFWAGVGCLIGSMIVLLITSGSAAMAYAIFVFGYPLLFLGIYLSKRGAFNNRRHGVGGYKLAPEEVEIDNQLKGVPPRYHLYSYLNIGGIPIEHLLVTPQGFIILRMQAQLGRLKAGRDLYRMKKGFMNTIGTVGEPGIGNPSQELSRQCKRLRTWFESKGYDIPVDGIVVMYNPRASIESVIDMSFPVCMLKDLREAIRQWQTELNMLADEQLEVEKLIIETLPEAEAADALERLTMSPAKRAALERESLPEPVKPEKKKAEPKMPRERKTPTSIVPQPGQRVGLNGKPLPAKTVKDKPRKRMVEPLQKPNPGAHGDPDKRKKF